jgi:hypothetical protein
MKKTLLVLSCLCCFSIFSFGQKFSVAAEKENILYIGMDNPISITVDNLSSKSIIVKTDNGEITGNDGQYVCHPKYVGRTNIMIYKKVLNG